MKYDPAIHHRRSIRLRRYDYSQAGAYFVTVCTQNRECLFGDIENDEMRLNDAGRLVASVWDALPGHYGHLELDALTIMPNHVHGIIVLVGGESVGDGFVGDQFVQGGSVQGGVGAGFVGAGFKPAPTTATPTAPPTSAPTRHGLPEIVRAFKTFASRRVNALRNTPGTKLWQRNYWEHVIRNEPELNRIRAYIRDNPARWEMDKLFVDRQAYGPASTEIREPPAEYATEAWMV